MLKSLYDETLRIIDERVGLIIETFRTLRNWNRTCFIVTSDHGQAFGEDSTLFHGFGGSDAVHRVPLVVKSPASNLLGVNEHAWWSVKDIPDLILDGVQEIRGGAQFNSNSGAMRGGGPDQVVFSLVDQAPDYNGSASQGQVFTEGRQQIVAYQGDTKYVIDIGTDRILVSKLSKSITGCPTPLKLNIEATSARLRELRDVVSRLESDGISPTGVAQRMHSWGYF